MSRQAVSKILSQFKSGEEKVNSKGLEYKKVARATYDKVVALYIINFIEIVYHQHGVLYIIIAKENPAYG